MNCEGCVELNRVGNCSICGKKPLHITNCTVKMTKEEVKEMQKKAVNDG